MSYTDVLDRTVDVETRGTPTKGVRGGDDTAYALRLTAVPCRFTTPRDGEAERFAIRQVQITHKVYFAGGTRLTNADRLVYTDAVTGATRRLAVHAAVDPHERGVMTVAMCEELPTPTPP